LKRTDLLRDLLEGIHGLTFEKVPAPEIQVIVADNDECGSAADVCRSFSMSRPIKYVIEPRRGISQTRNRAIREAGDVDFIAFIDDDEIPVPAWLDGLLWAQKQFVADVVCGPVLPSFTADVPEWLRNGGLLDRQSHASGPVPNHYICPTGNVLLRRAVFERVAGFDEQFGLTGGEDTHFFIRVRRAGFKIVWSAAAITHERYSTDRANLKWLLRRGYRGGNSWVLVQSTFDKNVSTRAVRVVKAFGWIVLGGLKIPLAIFLGRAAMTRALRSIWLGAGMLAGLIDWRYEEYKVAGSNASK
jgi:succinoglycan biosynthesis protein ExoM